MGREPEVAKLGLGWVSYLFFSTSIFKLKVNGMAYIGFESF